VAPRVSVVIPLRSGDRLDPAIEAALADDPAVAEVVIVPDGGDGPAAARLRTGGR
jgi:hypothetical protein